MSSSLAPPSPRARRTARLAADAGIVLVVALFLAYALGWVDLKEGNAPGLVAGVLAWLRCLLGGREGAA